MPVFWCFSAFFHEIQRCLDRKWPVFPLIGGDNLARGKRPARRWQVYTRRLPSVDEVQGWCHEGGTTAYGVVCGSVSGLVVLDLDDPLLAERFADRFPALLDTLTVRSGSRGTPHLYWQVDFPVKTRSFPGGDLRAEGSYVVGPGSVIAGCCWQVLTNRPVRAVSQAELSEVLDFLIPPQAACPAQPQPRKQPGDFVALYRFYVERFGGRNQALFTTACHMRDGGCSQAEAISTLAQVHAAQTSPRDGCVESYSRRWAEALRTIASAYSRPARNVHSNPGGERVSRLPNALRETLLKRPDGAAIARVIEAVHLIAPQTPFTEASLCRLLAGIISRETIRKALAACYDDGAAIFGPPQNPPAQADIPDGIERQKNAFLSAGQKQTNRKIYGVPAAETLCQRFGVTARGGDAITLDDLRSARRYRQALHLALLRRRPGVYSQALLADRLGVTARSIRRYHVDLGVQVQPTYQETPVLWFSLDQIPTAADAARYGLHTGGQFLIDETGQRWPLKREIAEMLLSQGRRVSHMRQGHSHYAIRDVSLPVMAADSVKSEAAIGGVCVEGADRGLASDDRTVRVESLPQPARRCPDFAPEGPSTLQSQPEQVSDRKSAPRRRKRYFRQPLPDSAAERLAQRASRRVTGLSLPNARRLIETYGSESLAAALRRFQRLNELGKVERPAGLLVTLTRTSWRQRSRVDGPAPRFTAEPARRSRTARYVHPTRDPLWQSAVYQDWRAEFFGLDDPLPQVVIEEIGF